MPFRLLTGLAEEAEHDQQVVDPHDAVGVHIGRTAGGIASEDAERFEQVAHIAETVLVDVPEAEGAGCDASAADGLHERMLSRLPIKRSRVHDAEIAPSSALYGGGSGAGGEVMM